MNYEPTNDLFFVSAMLKLYNTLTKKIDEFTPLHAPHVGMYTCGPTVYDYQHIGHMRRYVGDDLLIRVLQRNGFTVKQVMNITDVGHLVSDGDEGEDKMEKGAQKFNMSVWDIAKKFEKQFFDSMTALGITESSMLMHATAYIPQQIGLITTLEEKGFTYKTVDGIYFDTSKFAHYDALTPHPKEQEEGKRVAMGGKLHSTDFALWKFSPSNGEKRQMEWESPWGLGFPGWHVECSAMAIAALGPTIDIHTGGIDHVPIHHTNEVAQSEAATGKSFVRYFVHHNFLMVDGQKMSKSLGNTYTVDDVVKKGFAPMSLRYLYLQTHYRQEMNFTWEALTSAQHALERLHNEVSLWNKPSAADPAFLERFDDAIGDDVNMPKALGILWDLYHSGLPSDVKSATLLSFDEVFGLGLAAYVAKPQKLSEEAAGLLERREAARKKGDFTEADRIRKQIDDLGFMIEDNMSGPIIKSKILRVKVTN